MLSIPKIKLSDESSFEAFNYYRSSAWQIRGVSNPLKSLHKAGNNDLYAYERVGNTVSYANMSGMYLLFTVTYFTD